MEKIIAYVKNNLTEENMVRWQRAFINKICYDKATYNKLAQRAMRECFKIAYPKPFEEMAKKYIVILVVKKILLINVWN